MLKKKRKKSKKQWLWEFSKKVVFILTLLYALERIFAMVVIAINSGSSLDLFLETGRDVFLSAVVSYALKAGFENVFKIKKRGENINEEVNQ